MNIRQPQAAYKGFYESSPTSCRHHVDKLLASVQLPGDLPARLYGGLVPHAGWGYSGRLAAMTFKALAAAGPVDTVVLLGAVHVGGVRMGEVFDSGVWQTPLGEVFVDEDLASAILRSDPCFRANPQAHAEEHSIEVQVPLLQVVCPQAKIVPIAVPPADLALRIGRAIGGVLAEAFPHAVVVGSTDLTHHGGQNFDAPGGRGEEGVRWTVANDRRMIDLVEAMKTEQILPEYRQRMNACGAGAVAAAMAAAGCLGATRGICLDYTNCHEVIQHLYPGNTDDTTVGYASVVFA
jgi:AmmeMemoRadiSam system protein B